MSLQEIISKNIQLLEGADGEFYGRVWNTPQTVYRNRLKAIGFESHAHVLDAGCGFGQWILGLASLNQQVTAFDYSDIRVKTLQNVVEHQKLSNVRALSASLENIPLPDQSFDAVFCYSVIYFTDWKKSVQEIARVMKPQGKLYLCANGLGWYLHNLINEHNSSASFDARQMAGDAIENTLQYLYENKRNPEKQLFIPSEYLTDELTKHNFDIIASVPEGTYQVNEGVSIKPFYQASYYNKEGVYEIIAVKK